MCIQTLESQKIDFIAAMKERDKLISQMQAETLQLREEKKHLQEVIGNLKSNAMEVFSEVDTLNKRIILLEK